MEKDYYVIMLWAEVEAKLYGPFKTAEIRDRKTRDLRSEWGCEHGFFRLETTKGTVVEIDCYVDDEFGE